MARKRTLLFPALSVAYKGHVSLDNAQPRARISRVMVLRDAYAGENADVRDLLDDGTVKGHVGYRVAANGLSATAAEAGQRLQDHVRDTLAKASKEIDEATREADSLPQLKL